MRQGKAIIWHLVIGGRSDKHCIGDDRVRNVRRSLLLEPNNINKLLLCSVIPQPFNFFMYKYIFFKSAWCRKLVILLPIKFLLLLYFANQTSAQAAVAYFHTCVFLIFVANYLSSSSERKEWHLLSFSCKLTEMPRLMLNLKIVCVWIGAELFLDSGLLGCDAMLLGEWFSCMCWREQVVSTRVK